MKKHFALAVTVALASTLGAVGTAAAQAGGVSDPDEPIVFTEASEVIGAAAADGRVRGFIYTGEPADVVIAGGTPGSRILYLNNCKGKKASRCPRSPSS